MEAMSRGTLPPPLWRPCGYDRDGTVSSPEKASYYLESAGRLMKALYDLCGAKDPKTSDGLLLHGVYGRKTLYNDCIDHGIDECNLWGDYFYMEGLRRLMSGIPTGNLPSVHTLSKVSIK